ncbi:MAG: hypothetical protein A2172_05310 [Candidatus Woykebacteria bacterium RBG_13_40_15]|uniref:DUF4258 domain-containing protein n=1 Tax=Candidatus Woykebacteria bacterium RBG_13_40_15 TaxID=1802593 RepID=A0A1G1W516_9BACT|nr:MAG: hypothetical protein A2172_05310 [Candidatus Woykebacteria bacterium RBG_13_40_15]
MELEEVRSKIRRGEYDLSEHAHAERQAEHITIKELEETVLSGEIIESYPKDPRGEGVLLGAKLKTRSLHVVCGKRDDRILIVTVYEPKPPKWIDYKTRSREVKSRR